MADLLVRLKLDDKALDAQLKGVSSKFAAASKGIAAIALPVAAIAAIARAVDGLAAIGEAAINTIAPLQDTAAQLGVTAERLQELRAVAGAAGVDVQQFDKALGTLNRTLGQAALGQGEFEEIARNAGLALRDEQGHIKDTSAVWDELTAAIQSGALSQNAAIGLAAAAFGREGGKMVQVLRQTAEEQQRVIDTAREFGAIISNEVVAAADEYEDKLALIKQGTAALGAQSDLVLAPLTLAWAGLKNEIAFTVAELARAAGLIDNNTTLMRRDADQLKRQIDLHRQYLDMTQHPAPLDDPLLQKLTSDWAALQRQIEAADAAAKAVTPPSTAGELVDPLETIDVGAKRIEAMRSFNQTVLNLEREAQMARLEQGITVEAQRIEALRSWQEIELQMVQEHEGLLTQAKREGEEARIAFANMSAGQQVSSVIGALEQMTAGVAQHSKKAFQVNKLAAIANAVVNTAQGVTKALAAYPPPLSFAMAAAQAAAGAAQISAIKSTSFEGGGRGTTPSSAATPVVNDQPTNQIITVRGVNPDQLFTGRQLVDLLNQATKDGAKLVFSN